jgi:GT2 family glycosyltransferase
VKSTQYPQLSGERPLVSIVIVTRNRSKLLWQCLATCMAQNYRPIEILVYDDASSEDPGPALRRDFPQVRYTRSNQFMGLIAYRNRGFVEAGGQYVFWIDDDAYYCCNDALSRAVGQFEHNPRIGAIAMPFVEPLASPGMAARHKIPAAGDSLRTFVGCAAAFRKNAVLAVGGLRDSYLIYGGEEKDLAVRLMDLGYCIAYGSLLSIVHLRSPIRQVTLQERYAIRSQLLFDWLNVPALTLVPRLTYHALRLACHCCWPPRRWLCRVAFVLAGLTACIRHTSRRNPVSRQTYRCFVELADHRFEPWDELRLPVPAGAAGPEVAVA